MLLLIFAGNVEAVEPFDTQAGMAAYVNVGSLNLENATEAYTQINNLSTSHAVGSINVPNNMGSDNIHVYVDSNGWIVAYLTRGEQLGHMIQWAGVDVNNPTVKTTFEDAISRVCTSIGVNYSVIQGNIKYYDFEYPQATNALIFMNTRISGSDYTTVLIPESYSIYSMNYSHIGYGGQGTTVYIDGINICYGGGIMLNSYNPSMLTKDIPHTIQLTSNYWSGLASIFVYK